MIQSIRWLIAIIVGVAASVICGGISVYLFGLMDAWFPFPVMAGGFVSAISFVYFGFLVSKYKEEKTVRILASVLFVISVISLAGNMAGQSSPEPGIGLMLGAIGVLLNPKILISMKKTPS